MLQSFPTTIEQDKHLLQQINHTSLSLSHSTTQGAYQSRHADADPMRPANYQLAIAYRLARKKTLQTAVTDLESMACLLDVAQAL